MGDDHGWRFVFFGIALAYTYLLALFSFRQLQQMLGCPGWWLLRRVGMNYIAYAFAFDFLHNRFIGVAKHVAEYLPFASSASSPGAAVRPAASYSAHGNLRTVTAPRL